MTALPRLALRTATSEDAEVVHTLMLEIAAHEQSLPSIRATVADWERMLARPDVRVLLALADDVLGYASTVRRLAPWEGRDVLALDDLYVREAARNRGVGRALMSAVARIATEDDLTVVWGAALGNVHGHRFYRRLGATLTTKVAASWAPDDYRWATV